MPIFKTKKENFFKKWTPEMAYVLGFFCADGSMSKNKRGAHFIEFQITDGDLIKKIRSVLDSNHKITVRKKNDKHKPTYRLQIGSKTIFNDLIKLGLTPNKSKTICLPDIPDKYFGDFTRGYFDGDGNVVCGYFKKSDRKSKSPILSVRFTSGSESFLRQLKIALQNSLNLSGSIHYNAGWRLAYSTNDSRNLFRFMYAKADSLFLNRKRKIFLRDNQLGTVA